jgi:hypothetical protein
MRWIVWGHVFGGSGNASDEHEGDCRTVQFPDGYEVPNTTLRAERQRLVSKGQFLAEHCLDDGHMDCVLGFVDHCLGKSPPQLDVVADLWAKLRQEHEQLSAGTNAADEPRAVLLRELLEEVASRLTHALTPRDPEAPASQPRAGEAPNAFEG